MRGGGAFASKKLLAAFAVLAVAFVVLAALPAAVTGSDAADDAAPSYKEGVIAAGYIDDEVTAKGLLSLLTGKDVPDAAANTMFVMYYTGAGWTSGTAAVNNVTNCDSVNVSEGLHLFYFRVSADATVDDSNAIIKDWDSKTEYNVVISLNGDGDKTETIESRIVGKTVTLYQDVDATIEGKDKYVTINDSVVIDLNDKKLSVKKINETGFEGSNRVFDVSTDASLSIIGDDNEKSILDINGDAKYYDRDDSKWKLYVSSSAIAVENRASATISGITYRTTGTALFPVTDASEVTVEDSHIDADGYGIGTNNSKAQDGFIKIDVKNSTIESGVAAVFINSKNVTLNIDGSTIVGIEGATHAVVVRAGTATITGSDLISENNGDVLSAWDTGTAITSATLAIGNKDKTPFSGKAIVTMTGGSIEAKTGNALVIMNMDAMGQTETSVFISTEIKCGDEAVTVENLEYASSNSTDGKKPLLVKKGSVELSGALDEITIVSGKATVSDDLSVNAGLVLEDGAEVSVAEGKKITIADGAEFTVENGAGLYLGKGASIVKKDASGHDTPVYIPGSTIVFGTTEYTVFTYTFDGIYTLYYGLANQPVVFDGAEVDPKDIVASVRSLYCVDDAGAEVDAKMSLTGDCTFYEDAIGAVYPGSYSYVEIKVKVDIDGATGYASYSLFAKTNLVIAKAPMAGADCEVEEGLVYNGEVQDPETSVSFMDELLPEGSYTVEYFSDAACTVAVDVLHAGRYYAKFTATDSNPYFAGSKVVEFQVGKSAGRALEVEVDPVMAGKNYVWNAGAYRSNIHVTLKDAFAAYTVDYGTGAGYVDQPRFGTEGVSFIDQASFDAIIASIDSTTTAEYTLFLRFNTTDAVDYRDVSMMVVKIFVGPMGYTITVDDSIVGGTIVAPASAIAGDEVELTVTSDEKYRTGTVSYTIDGTTTSETITGGKFTMPAGNITVTSTFVRMYEVDFNADTTIVKAGDRALPPGEIVDKNTVLSISAPTGYRIVSATYEEDGEDVVIDDLDNFLMPEHDIYITVVTEVDLKIIFVEEGYRDIVFEIDSEGDFFYLPSPANHDRWVLTVGEDKRFYNPMSGYVPVLEDADDAGRIVFNAVYIEDDEEVVTVTFVYGLDGETEYVFDVVKGEPIGIFPAAAYVDGKILSWTCDGVSVNENTIADGDMIITATYTDAPVVDETVRVTFVYGENSYAIDVKKDSNVKAFPDASVEGYTYVWKIGDRDVTDGFLANEDTEVIAVYTAIEPVVPTTGDVVFVFGSTVETVTLPLGALVVPESVKTAAAKEGYVLAWFYNGAAITAGTQVVDGMVVVAEYTEIPVEPEYSEIMTVALVLSNGKIYYTITAADGKIIPAGKLTIEYSYLDDSGKYPVYRLVEDIITVENVDGTTFFGTIEPTVDIYSYSASFVFGDKTIGSPTYFVEASA